MKALVLFDSNFGNTKLVADAIAKELGGNARAVSVNDFRKYDLEDTELLIAGCPINGWRPSEKMIRFLMKLEDGQLKNIKAAAFDTRVKTILSGNAAKKISKSLENAGAEIIAHPQAFFVQAKEGPLFDEEIEKAKSWARFLKSELSKALVYQ